MRPPPKVRDMVSCHGSQTVTGLLFDLMTSDLLTSALQEKREDISCHEDLGHPLDGHHAEVLGLKVGNRAAEDHVDRRRV